ncbi:hypothetical protein D3C75_740350 [compost metagenome]
MSQNACRLSGLLQRKPICPSARHNGIPPFYPNPQPSVRSNPLQRKAQPQPRSSPRISLPTDQPACFFPDPPTLEDVRRSPRSMPIPPGFHRPMRPVAPSIPLCRLRQKACLLWGRSSAGPHHCCRSRLPFLLQDCPARFLLCRLPLPASAPPPAVQAARLPGPAAVDLRRAPGHVHRLTPPPLYRPQPCPD